MDGMLLVDKPAGWTSHDIVGYVRKTLGIKRAGHTGTLDPDATGLLVVLIGKATRLAKYHEADTKAYQAVMSLGAETDTEDAGGNVTRECPVPELDEGSITAVFDRFTGEIEQVPPMYSAVKVDGAPLYKAARRGKEVERKPRKVTVHGLRLLGVEGGLVSFEAVCSKGTYIRTLCRDMGAALGSCAHMHSLRRTGVGGYDLTGSLDVGGRPGRDALEDAIIPLDRLLTHLPAVRLSGEAAGRVSDGVRPVSADIAGLDGEPAPGGYVRVEGPGGELFAVGIFTGEDDPAVVLDTVIPK